MSSISGTITTGVTLATAGNYLSPLTITSLGYISNSGDAIFGPGSQAWTVANYGLVRSADGNGIRLDDGGLVTNADGATIGGNSDGILIENQSGTVINAGAITGTQFEGIYLNAGGQVSNASTGVIFGADEGVYASYQAATVTNAGRIAAQTFAAVYLSAGGVVSNAGGMIEGGREGVRIVNESGTVGNSGAISGGMAPGVYLGAGGAVVNSGGLIEGLVNGVYIGGSAGTVSNTGLILGLGAHGVGVTLGQGGTVVNGGMIKGDGGIAVGFGGSGANRLVLEPGNTLNGMVAGSTSGGATNTLELASATNSGTVTGLGTAITNFGTLQFDSGAHWTAEGSAAGMPSVINGFAAGDTIDVDGFSAVSETYSDSGLVLTDAISNSVTLGIRGSFSTSDFVLSSDQHGGTDVTVAAATPSMPSEVLGGPYIGDENSVVPLGGITVAVSPNSDDPLSVTLSVSSGTLSAGGESGASITLAGTAAALDAVFAGLSYSGATNFYGSDTLSMTTTDTVDHNQATGSVGIAINPNVINVGNSDVTIILGDGNDTVNLGTGSDTVTGGNGNDIITAKHGFGNDSVTLGNGNDRVTLANGNNTVILGGGNDAVSLGQGNNTIAITGSPASTDSVTAGNGNNSLTLGPGTYNVVLGNGDNSIDMNGGTYNVTAGHGTDLFIFETLEALLDLKFASNDKLIFRNSGFDFGSFDGLGTSTPQQLPGSLFSSSNDGTFTTADQRFAYQQSTGDLYYNAQGNNAGSVSDLVAHFTNAPHLTAANLFFTK